MIARGVDCIISNHPDVLCRVADDVCDWKALPHCILQCGSSSWSQIYLYNEKHLKSEGLIVTSNYFVAENGVTQRSRRFSAFIGCLRDDILHNSDYKIENPVWLPVRNQTGFVRMHPGNRQLTVGKWISSLSPLRQDFRCCSGAADQIRTGDLILTKRFLAFFIIISVCF